MPMTKVHKVKCEECNKVIEGISEREVNAWLEQHRHYAHNQKEDWLKMKCKNCSIYVEWDVICGECKSEEKSQELLVGTDEYNA